MKYIGYLTKGLESVGEKEITNLLKEVKILEIKDKRIIFDTNEDPKLLSKLRTIDDIGVLLGKKESVINAQDIGNWINEQNLTDTKSFINKIRVTNNNFSLTVGLVSTNFKSIELINEISKNIQEKYHWNFTEFDRSNFDIRFFIDHKTAYVSIRLTCESLQHRTYKTVSKKGSLKPTVAAAMLALVTDFNINLKIIDNFCGSGTILCESVLVGNQVFGGDIDLESVKITQQNLANLGYNSEEKIKLLNAIKTNWPSFYFDCAISNLPWDKQVEVKSITELYEGSIKEYFRILKQNGVLCVIVSKPELFIKFVKKYKQNPNIKTFKIGLLGQNPTIILAH